MPKNISRIDTGQTHGWQVRLSYRGRRFSRFFSDRKHGSSEEARQAAERYRDELLRGLDLSPNRDPTSHLQSEEVRQRQHEALSRTGIRGLTVTWREYGGDPIPYVQAYFEDEEGRPRSVQRSTAVAGTRRAVKDICRVLVEQREEYDDVDALYRRAIRSVNRLIREEAV